MLKIMFLKFRALPRVVCTASDRQLLRAAQAVGTRPDAISQRTRYRGLKQMPPSLTRAHPNVKVIATNFTFGVQSSTFDIFPAPIGAQPPRRAIPYSHRYRSKRIVQ